MPRLMPAVWQAIGFIGRQGRPVALPVRATVPAGDVASFDRVNLWAWARRSCVGPLAKVAGPRCYADAERRERSQRRQGHRQCEQADELIRSNDDVDDEEEYEYYYEDEGEDADTSKDARS